MTRSLSLELAFLLIKTLWGSEWNIHLLESVFEDGAYKARIFAVIDIVWAESPGKYLTEVHLVSLLTSFELTSVWERLNPLEDIRLGYGWMCSSVSVTFQCVILESLLQIDLDFFFLNVYILFWKAFMKRTHGGLCKSQTELVGTAGQSQ